MLVDLQAILKELKETISGNFRQAEKNMYNRMRDDPNTSVCLAEILVHNHQCKHHLTSEQIKLVAASFLNTSFLQQLEEGDESTLKRINQQMARILLNQRVSVSCKRNFNRTLSALMECLSQSQIESHNLISEWITLAVTLLNSDMASPTVYMLMEAFSKAQVRESDLMEFVNNVGGLSISNLMRGNKSVEQLEEWADAFYQLFEKMTELQEESRNFVIEHLIREVCQNEQLIVVIFNIYMLGCHEDRVLISADSSINQLKEQVANLHVMMVVYMYKNQKSVPFQPLHIQLLAKLLPYMIQTMLMVSKCPDQFLDRDNRARDFAIEIMKLLEYCVKQNETNKLVYHESQAILLNIVLPLFRTTKSQIQMFEQNSHDFCEFANDITDRQNIHTLKSQAASLLESILDTVDGSTTFVFDISINSILINYNIEEVRTPFLLSTEAALMVLSIMSYMYQHKRRDLLDKLKMLFVHQFKIVQAFSPMELAWFYIFMSYNFSDIFPEARDGQPYILHAVFYEGHPTTRSAALEFVMSVVENYYTEDMFKKIVDRVETSNCFSLWQIFMKYFAHNNWLLEETPATYLVAKLIQRIKIEFQSFPNKNKKMLNFTYISKCLMVLLTISRKSTYLRDKPTLQAEMWAITQFLQSGAREEIAGEILKILSQLMLLHPTLSQKEIQLLPVLNKIQNKTEYRHIFTPMSKLINMYLFKVPVMHTPQKRLLFEMCLGVMKPRMVDRDEKDYDIGILLTQIFVVRFQAVICKEELAEIQVTLREVKNKIHHNILKCRLLNLKILMYPLELAMGLKTQNFTTQLLGLQEDYRMQYDRKVLIFGICRCLFYQPDFLSVGEMLNVSARTLENYWKNADQQKFESKYSEQHKKTLNRLKSDWNHFDIYGHFQQKIMEAQQNNPKMFKQLFDTLTSDVKQLLREIAKMKTIHNTPRKLIKVNKNNTRVNPLPLNGFKTNRDREMIEEDHLYNESSDMEEQVHDKKMKKIKL